MKKKRHQFAYKVPYSESYGFAQYYLSSNILSHICTNMRVSHIWFITECQRNGAFKLVLEKTFESSLNCNEIKQVNPKGNQSWIYMARIDAEAEAPVLWPPDVMNQLIGKDPDAGEDWRQKKDMTEGEMVGWPHQFNGHEFKQILGDSEGQGSLACCSPWVAKSRTWLSDWKTMTTLHLDEVGDGNRVQVGGGVCIPMAESCWYMAEINTIF